MSDKPGGLPPIPRGHGRSTIDRNRICNKCGEEGRVISNSGGVSVFCNKCKFAWPVSGVALDSTLAVTPSRGVVKRTLVEPDWDLAYEDLEDNRGPPKK